MGNNRNNSKTLSVPDRFKQLFISPKGDPAGTLARAYILALGIIAFLTIASHLITTYISEQQKESAAISHYLGQQRTMLQQTASYAGSFYNTNDEFDFNLMMQSLDELERVHKELLTTMHGKHFFMVKESQALKRVFYHPPHNLNDRLANFYNMVRDFSQYDPQDRDKSKLEKRKEVLGNITRQATDLLRPSIDAALDTYQAEILDNVRYFYRIQHGATIFILVVLLAEALFIFQPMIGKIRNYNSMLQRYALEDSLTGLNNRRAFMKGAETEMNKARRQKKAITVALLDLDHFKQINDTYGHEVGDTVLKHFASLLKKTFRAGDITGRIGGEEFAILLPQTNYDDTVAILQRLCDSAAGTPCEYNSGGSKSSINYTVSIGFTGPVNIENQTIEELLARADQGLYKAKEEGRNRIATTDEVPVASSPAAAPVRKTVSQS